MSFRLWRLNEGELFDNLILCICETLVEVQFGISDGLIHSLLFLQETD